MGHPQETKRIIDSSGKLERLQSYIEKVLQNTRPRASIVPEYVLPLKSYQNKLRKTFMTIILTSLDLGKYMLNNIFQQALDVFPTAHK